MGVGKWESAKVLPLATRRGLTEGSPEVEGGAEPWTEAPPGKSEKIKKQTRKHHIKTLETKEKTPILGLFRFKF